VLAARQRIAPYLRPTPLFTYAALSDLVGTDTFVKHENHQPVGAFKVRGGVNLVAQLTEDERRAGVMSASTGNHGQSIAFAAGIFGVSATIFVPNGANPVKVAAMRGLGAEVVFHGRDFDDARVHCDARGAAHRCPLHPLGQRAPPDRRRGDRLARDLRVAARHRRADRARRRRQRACGACIVARAVRPGTRVIGVQSSAAPAAHRSWQEGRLVDDETSTVAEGLATRTAFELTQAILREHLDDFVLVTDDQILDAQAIMIETTRQPRRGGRRRRPCCRADDARRVARPASRHRGQRRHATPDQVSAVLARRSRRGSLTAQARSKPLQVCRLG
jgi:threonine dehydratase